jgi:hypothetical protein
MSNIGLVKKFLNDVEQMCINDVFTLFLCVEKHWLWVLFFEKIIYLLDYFQSYLRVNAHYIVHKMLSQSKFCKILKFVIGHVIKYKWLS